MTDLARSSAAVGFAILIHALAISVIRLPEQVSPTKQSTVAIRFRPRSAPTVHQSPVDAPRDDAPEPDSHRSGSARETPSRNDITIPERDGSTETIAEPSSSIAIEEAQDGHAIDERQSTGLAATDAVARSFGNSNSGAAPAIAEIPTRRTPPPTYPERARRAGHEGIVELEVLVDDRGRVQEAIVVSSSGFESLDDAARAAVVRWRFERGDKDRRTRRRFEFRLENP